MTELTETSAPSARSEPFVGVAVVLAWLLASGGLGLMAVDHLDVQAAAVYTRALPCPAGTRQLPAGTEPVGAAQATALSCRQELTVTVRETTAPITVPDHVVVVADGVPVRVEPASSGDAQLLAGAGPGTRLQAVRWRGLLTELSTSSGSVRTVDNPAATLSGNRLSVTALLALATVLAMVAAGPALGRVAAHLHRLARRLATRPRVRIPPAPAEGPAESGVPLRRAG